MNDNHMLNLLAVQDLAIATIGWAITGVLPEPGEAHYAYTIGLTETGAPELVITGLHPAVAQVLLNDMAQRAHQHGVRWRHHDRIGDLIRDYDALIVDGTANERIAPGTANSRYGARSVRLQQIVWPDPAGLYPWEPGYRHPPTAQPLLTPTS